MRILMINVVCGIRSTGRICTDLATALEAEGHEVKIAYGREEVPEKFKKYAVRIGTDWDVRLHGVRARLFDDAGFGSKKVTEYFVEWIKKYDPDVIHLHNLHGYYINIDVLFKYLRDCGKKIIWTLHDCWPFTGHTAYCDAVRCEKWESGCYQCPQIKEYPKSYVDHSNRNWKRKKDIFSSIPNLTIVTPSKWLASLVKKSFLKEYCVEVIHNGIDTSQFCPLTNDFRDVNGLKDKYIVLGVASVWDDMKGLSDFIELSKRLDESYKIVLVGLNEKQLQSIPANILGIKRTASVKELSYIYSAADVFLNLTYCDNYPTTNIEAMACGTPVITYDTGGSTEIVEKYGGIILPRGNINAVVDTLLKKEEAISKCLFKSRENDNQTLLKRYIDIAHNESSVCGGGGYWQKKDELGIISKYIILGVAAIWDKRKGLEDFVKLGKLLDDKYQIILVGINEEQMNRLPSNIIGYTRTNNVQELKSLYGIADIFVNPTYEDNYPTTNLEAISCGTPVITYETGGSPESAELFGQAVDKKASSIVEAIQRKNYRKICDLNQIDCSWNVQEYKRLYLEL